MTKDNNASLALPTKIWTALLIPFELIMDLGISAWRTWRYIHLMFLVLNINTEVNKTSVFEKIISILSLTILILNKISLTRYTMKIVKEKKCFTVSKKKKKNGIFKNLFHAGFNINKTNVNLTQNSCKSFQWVVP